MICASGLKHPTVISCDILMTQAVSLLCLQDPKSEEDLSGTKDCSHVLKHRSSSQSGEASLSRCTGAENEPSAPRATPAGCSAGGPVSGACQALSARPGRQQRPQRHPPAVSPHGPPGKACLLCPDPLHPGPQECLLAMPSGREAMVCPPRHLLPSEHASQSVLE